MLSPRDLGWAAGFLDGEGCFRRRESGGIEASASQVDRELLDRLRQMFGGSIYFKRRPPGHRSQDYYSWRIGGSAAIGMMYTIYPMLSVRRKLQVRRVIEIWRTLPGKGHQRLKTHCFRGHPFDADNTWTRVNREGYLSRWCRQCGKIREQRRIRIVPPSA